jgi:hypothetical protein
LIDPKKDDPFSVVKDSIIPMDMFYVPALIGGEQARDLLMYNREPEVGKEATNRKASPGTVKSYSLVQLSGDWYLNPHPIVFSEPDENGVVEMTDGQQRLKALVLASQTNPELTVPFVLCFKSPRAAKWFFDQGKRRLPGDFLRMRGEVNSNQLSHALRMLYAVEEMRPFKSIAVWRAVKLTSVTQDEFLERHPGLRRGLQVARDTKGLVMPHVGAVLHYLVTREFGPYRADTLFRGLASGAEMATTDPRLVVREFISMKAREKPRAYKWDGFEQLALLIAATNAWLIGQDNFTPRYAFNKLAKTFPILFTAQEMPKTTIVPGNDPNLDPTPAAQLEEVS